MSAGTQSYQLSQRNYQQFVGSSWHREGFTDI